MAISYWCSDSNCCSIFLTTSHISIFLFSISAAMITAPISEHLPGRLIKAPPPPGQRLGQIREDGSAADDGVTMRIVSPACLAPLGHRLCRRSTNGHQRGHQWWKLKLSHKTSVRRQSSCPGTSSATGRRQLSWKFAAKMIYLELL